MQEKSAMKGNNQMKRSEINAAIEHAKGLMVKYRISLPHF